MRTLTLIIFIVVSAAAVPIRIDFDGIVTAAISYDISTFELKMNDEQNPCFFNYDTDDVFNMSVLVDVDETGYSSDKSILENEGLFYHFEMDKRPELIKYKNSDVTIGDYQLVSSFGYGFTNDPTKAERANTADIRYADPLVDGLYYDYCLFLLDGKSWESLQVGNKADFGEQVTMPEESSAGIENIAFARLTVTNVTRFEEPDANQIAVCEPSLLMMAGFGILLLIPFVRIHQNSSS